MTVQEAMAAVKATPRNPDTWATLGEAFAEAGNEEKARKSYGEALKLAPQHAGALAGLAALEAPPELPAWLDEPVALSAPPAPHPAPPRPALAPWLQSETTVHTEPQQLSTPPKALGLGPGQRPWDSPFPAASPSRPSIFAYSQQLGARRRQLALAGAAALCLGVFAPLISVPLAGTLNYFANGRGDGIFVLGAGVLSFLLIFKEWYPSLWLTGLASAYILLNGFIRFSFIDTGGLFQAQMEWGWFLMGAGVLLTLTAASYGEGEASSTQRWANLLGGMAFVGLGLWGGQEWFRQLARSEQIFQVSYNVTGTADLASLTLDVSGRDDEEGVVYLPWTATARLKRGTRVYLTASNRTGDGTLMCAIWVDSKRWKADSASGGAGFVTCSGTIGSD